MSDVTDADRAKATDVAMRLFPEGHERDHAVDAIAAALAEEREKARAPFLRLASEFGSWPSARILSPHDAGDRIRRAALETE